MKFVLGIKQNMSQIFDEEGSVIPVTLLSVPPMVVTQIKDEKRDGYKSVQIGFSEKKEKNISKPIKGHLKGLGNFAFLREFNYSEDQKFKVGDTIKSDIFSPGDIVAVSSISKGKGFQGVVKRHGFKGGPRTHGQKHSEREPGSIGMTGPQRVMKGKRMPGRMGGDRVTVKNLKVVAVDPQTQIILVSGAVPGRRGTLVEIRSI